MSAALQPGKGSAVAESGWIRNFFPGYFALVMATGIVSLAAHFQGLNRVANLMLWLNVPAYLFLTAVTFIRFALYRAAFLDDLTSHARGGAFLSQVAATCVLGKQIATLTPYLSVSKWLWMIAVVLWFALIYTFFAAITLREPKPRLEAGINGSWMLVTVSTESLCTLGTLVAPAFAHGELVLFISLLAFLLGAMLYVVLITMIFYRWIFRSMEATMLTPPYWINMGALAITTLAGGRLMVALDASHILSPYRPFILGFTLFFWATATWWIPLLVVVGVWRHITQKLPLQYDPQYWSLVFPLGMYSVSTHVFSTVTNLPFMKPIPLFFAIFALAAWIIALCGLCRHIIIFRRS
jgi:tellurite resistance protein TehA-like permease